MAVRTTTRKYTSPSRRRRGRKSRSTASGKSASTAEKRKRREAAAKRRRTLEKKEKRARRARRRARRTRRENAARHALYPWEYENFVRPVGTMGCHHRNRGSCDADPNCEFTPLGCRDKVDVMWGNRYEGPINRF